jgi:dTMP kinase
MSRLIAVEGLEGTGKTTLATALVAALQARGIEAVYAKQPGQVLSGYCRKALLEHQPDTLSQLFLMLADRIESIKTVIQPALAKGQWVIVDRYTDSTIAYQWFAANDRQLKKVFDDNFGWFEKFLNHVQFNLVPDAILLLHANYAVRTDRLDRRAEEMRLGQTNAQFNARLQAYFIHTLPYLRGELVSVIDTEQPLEESVSRALKACLAVA